MNALAGFAGLCLKEPSRNQLAGSLALPRAPNRAKATSLSPVLGTTALTFRPKIREVDYTCVSVTLASF